MSKLDDLACGQLGLVTFAQLQEAKYKRGQVRWMLDEERIVPVRHHVYRVAGAPQTTEQEILTAVLAAGDGAFASHEIACSMWELPLPGIAQVEVTTVLERCPRLDGVRVHRSGLLEDLDMCVLRSIPVSSVDRAVIELSSRFDVTTLGRVTDEALRRRLTTIGRIRSTARRLRRAPGRSPKKVEEMLARRIPHTETRESPLEDFVFDALRRFRLPLPVPQHEIVVEGRVRRIDHSYPERKLALEAQGYAYHGGRSQFDADAMRGNELRLAGWSVLEFTSAFTDWQIADQVARALGRPRPPRPERPLTFAEWCRLR
jgi:hypothetical protein